jgi:hypothetical protein
MAITDSERFEALAERYRREAETWLETALRTDGPIRMELIITAARWYQLAQEADAHRRLNWGPSPGLAIH